MKTLSHLVALLLFSKLIFAQSIVIGDGSSIEVGTGSDICAGVYGNITGNLFGTGTQCSEDTLHTFQMAVKFFLEGPFSGGSMSTALNTGGYIQTTQPFNTAPWNYAGTENVSIIPSGVVDWTLIELRSTTTTVVARRAAFIKSDGSLVDLNGTSQLSFAGVPLGNYYVVIYHRNHLAVMTSNTVSLSNNPILYDLTLAQTQAYGTNSMKNLAAGVFGLYTADTDGSGTVNATDRSNTWNQRNLSGYYGTDVDLSGTVNAADRSATWNNRNLSTQVPTPIDNPDGEVIIYKRVNPETETGSSNE
ncbi:MAG: hypothetical protein MUE64_06410 [Ignavibacteriaceae bacterium]|jgi:hypothetical protein|nr:hypothetical protein [Ignavibacteriaceae bacterium]